MTIEIAITLSTVVLLLGVLASQKMGPDTAMLGALTLLMVAGVFDSITDALQGFAHPSVMMIGALYVIAAGINHTGAMEMIAQKFLGRPKSIAGAQLRLMAPVALISAFMNTTPVVVIYLPIVRDWARKLGFSPSKLLIPLSYAAILGGVCSLIGTSSNITIMRLYTDYAEAKSFTIPTATQQFWWIALIGVPVAITGITIVVLGSRWLLPDRQPPDAGVEDGERKYTVQVSVEQNSPIAGKTIEQAGLRNLPGLYLTSIQRGVQTLEAPGPDATIEPGDTLEFAGVVESVVDLLKIKGLTPATTQVQKVRADWRARTIVEAVISHNSPLVRQSVRDSQFRTQYNAAIIAVHRGGKRVEGRIGDIVLEPGDTLLLATHTGFAKAYRNSDHFYLVSQVEGASQVRHERAGVALAILGLLIILLAVPFSLFSNMARVTFGVQLPSEFPPVAAAFLCAMLMVVLRCCTGTQARESVGWQILIVIGAALGIGAAMDQTGAAAWIAGGVVQVCQTLGLGPRGILFATLLLSAALAQLITNNGVAALMFPIVMALAENQQISPVPYMVALMVVAGCNTLTATGYQTNLMVYGPGGYKYTDFIRVGAPVTLATCTIATLLAPVIWPFQP